MNDIATLRQTHNLALLCPLEFSQRRMLQHWTAPRPEGLGQHSSSALVTLWRIMGETFQLAIIEAATGVQSPWRILQPPTGTGKTQGTCVYAAMQAEFNRETEGALSPVGMLIVTRLKEDADNIRDAINGLANRTVAVVHHSANHASPAQLHASDVVVITHQAFINAKRDQRDRDWHPWERLVSWRGGKRVLTIIDEALANVVDESHISPENLAFVISRIPTDVRSAFPMQVLFLEQALTIIQAFSDPEGLDGSMSMIWKEGPDITVPDFTPFIAAMRDLPYDRVVFGHSNARDNIRLADRVAKTITSVEALLTQFAYYSKSGDWHAINTAALAVPLNAPGPVVLDATARSNFLWDLFAERHQRPAVPGNARNYSSVRLHVARGNGIGKTAMAARIRERLPRLKRALEEAIRPECSVFVCVHKDIEDIITKKPKNAKSWTEKLNLSKCAVGHWGAVDGRNTWQDCDTAVILGLPYLPHTWSTNVFFALQGAQDDQWLQSPEWKQFKNVRKVMEQRQISVSVIQAINRICCRHVIDAEGHCPPANVFIVLPQDALGDAVLDDIKADMPGIRVEPWDFAIDPVKEKKPRIGSSHARLIEYVAKLSPGTVSLSTIQHDLQLSSVKKLRETLNDGDHPTTQALSDMGISYVPGVGRGSKSYLMKAA